MFETRFAFACAVTLCAFCGCYDSDRRQRDAVPAVRHIVHQLKENGGRKLNSVHICDEIESEIASIVDGEMRVRYVCSASGVIASVDFSSLPYRDRVEAAHKYWQLFSQFYGFLSRPGISDAQRKSFLVSCMKKYKEVSFSVPTSARQHDESDRDFAARRAAIRELYRGYSSNVRLWRRFLRSGALRTMWSIDGDSLDKDTAFFLEYPSETEFLNRPVFSDELPIRQRDKVMTSEGMTE